MRNKKAHIVIIVIFIIIIGVSIYYIYPVNSSIKLGLDLKGGTQIILKPTLQGEDEVTEESLDKAMLIIMDRIDKLGISEPLVTRDYSNNIIIQLPGVDDPNRAIEVIGKTAQLEFRILESVDEETGEVNLGPTLMTGDKLAKAGAGYDPNGRIIVKMSFTTEGQEIFEKITSENIGKQLAIVLDGEIKSAPVIRTEIAGDAVIEGIDSLDEAKDIALVLQTGALPVSLKIEESSTVGPTLGRDSLEKGLYAGIIGLSLIIIFMTAFYRGLGLISIIGIIVYILIFWGILAGIDAAITLPGIAGIILTIGMAVDANVIIFERIKEEIRKDKSARVAIGEGFRNGMRTIIDANVTTLITAAALYRFGTGSIRGFAVTLSLGVIISMLTSLVLTRSILFLVSGSDIALAPGFTGIKRKHIKQNEKLQKQ
ncbi:MAG: protein translocase subunit SecD [Actinobacteria bacterium]|nr:protein translocase subunit SecD [Actinomycetota bacterium]MBL7060432.1 protein translocase subunit SecD [Actinomycetota bacterium]